MPLLWKNNDKKKLLFAAVIVIILSVGWWGYRYLDTRLSLYRLGVSVWHRDRRTFLKYVALSQIVTQVVNQTGHDINDTYSRGTKNRTWSKLELEFGRELLKNASRTIRRAIRKSVAFEISTNLYQTERDRKPTKGIIQELKIYFRVISAVRGFSFQRISPIRAKIKIKRTETLGGESPYLGNKKTLTFRLRKKKFGYWKIVGLDLS
ncbi:MAG: hypothetical protein ACE5GM_06790 [bacterium]